MGDNASTAINLVLIRKLIYIHSFEASIKMPNIITYFQELFEYPHHFNQQVITAFIAHESEVSEKIASEFRVKGIKPITSDYIFYKR